MLLLHIMSDEKHAPFALRKRIERAAHQILDAGCRMAERRIPLI
jgi:hypothetical protein